MNLVKIRNIFIYLSIIGFFFFPFYQTILISIAFFLTFFTGEFKGYFSVFIKNKVAVVILLFFLIHLTSLLYTTNISSGWRGLEVKLSYLAFPLFLPIIFNSTKLNIYFLFKIMVVSGLIYCVSSFIRAGLIYLDTNNISDLLSSNLGFRIGQTHPFVHPTYVSLYLNFLILFLSYNLIKKELQIKKIVLSLGTILLFLIFILFSSSKLGILLMSVNVFIILTYYAITKSKIRQALILFSIFSIVSVVGIYNSPLKIRFQQAYKEVFHGNKNAKDYQMSTGTRIWTWKTTVEVIKENPVIGVGIGDIRDELIKQYKEFGITDKSRTRLDSHQQFLQTFATIGLSGITCLLFLFFILFRKAIKTKNIILFSFTLFYFLFGLTESMLETQAGIVFFTFMSLLLFQLPKEKLIED